VVDQVTQRLPAQVSSTARLPVAKVIAALEHSGVQLRVVSNATGTAAGDRGLEATEGAFTLQDVGRLPRTHRTAMELVRLVSVEGRPCARLPKVIAWYPGHVHVFYDPSRPTMDCAPSQRDLSSVILGVLARFTPSASVRVFPAADVKVARIRTCAVQGAPNATGVGTDRRPC
jgi:hypothetical protein